MNFKEEILLNINNVFSNYLLVGVLLVFLAVATYTDIKKMKIYNKFNIVFLLTRILFIFLPINVAMSVNYGLRFETTHAVGGAIGFVFLLIPAMALMHKMGGDIKFMAVLGTFLGGHLTVVFLILACVYNLIYALVSIYVLKKNKAKTNMPFAPFFMLAFLTILAYYLINPPMIFHILIA